MNKAQLITICIIAALWTIGGMRLLWSGSFLLMQSSSHIAGYLLVIGVLVAAVIGWAKGKFVLKKTSERTLLAVSVLEDNLLNCFVGWLKALGLRGLLVIGIMISLAILLGSSLLPIDPFFRGLIRVAIGIALLMGSLNYWSSIRRLNYE